MIPVSVMSDKVRTGVSLTMYIILSHAKEPCTRTAQSLRVGCSRRVTHKHAARCDAAMRVTTDVS